MLKNKAIHLGYEIPIWTIPLFLFVVTVIAYGLLAFFLGFYFDDWQMIWLIKSDASYWQFYSYDRPFSAWTLYITAPILGANPFAWHIFTMVLRWLVTWSGWWVLKLIWPKKLRLITLVAMLFAVYPVFLQHPISVAYSQHFLTYLFFMLSFGLMIASLKGNTLRFRIFTILGLITQAVHLFTMEYFWGLEFVRILGIYFYIDQRENLSPRDLVRKLLKSWSPYIPIFIAAIIWRIFIFAPAEDPNELILVARMLNEPINALLQLNEMVLQDSLHMLILAWVETLRVDLIDFQDKFLLLVWLILALISVGFVLYFRSLKIFTSKFDDSRWDEQLVIFGLSILFLGPLPAWLTERQITVGMYSDRFALAGMFGAAILVVLFLDRVLSTKFMVLVSVVVLSTLAIGLHIRVGNEFRWDWITQQRFFWQMRWRVPDLEPNTPIFADGIFLKYTGDYPTSFALNLLYPPDEGHLTKLPYWFFELDRGFVHHPDQFLNGMQMKGQLRNVSFEGWSLNGIVIDYNPREGNCLWVVGEGDELIYSLPGITQKALRLSDLSRMIPEDNESIDKLFGDEPDHTWCYYFQKAELARQLENWQQVSKLSDEVTLKGYEPQNRFEWRPFVEGYLRTGKYRAAYDLTLNANASGDPVQDLFCRMWIERVSEQPDDQLVMYAELIEDQLLCKWY